MNPAWTLSGKRALVTGGTRGIGRAIAGELLDLGCEVLIVARRSREMEDTVSTWTRDGLPAAGLVADVTVPADRQTIVNAVNDRWGRLDILINNVGTNIRKKALEYNTQEFDTIMKTNLMSVYEMTRLSFPFLKASGDAAVVHVSSVAALTHMRTGTIYAMTKAAINQFTRNLAVEWASDRIRVNAVAPWYTRTPLAEGVLKDPEYLAQVLARTPMGRIAEPEEIARVVAFLCLPASSYVTGQCFTVDGGFSIFGF